MPGDDSQWPANEVAVVGAAGTMGRGIVATLAAAGLDVVAVDVFEPGVAEARDAVFDQLVAALGPEEARAANERVVWQQRLQGRPIDLAIETVQEQADLKRTVIAELDRVLDPTAVIATNTSQFTPSELAIGATHRKRIAALHWFNPPPPGKSGCSKQCQAPTHLPTRSASSHSWPPTSTTA